MTDWVSAVRKPPQHRVNKDGSPDALLDSDCYLVRKHTLYCVGILFLSFILMIFYLPNERWCRNLETKKQYSDYFYVDNEQSAYNETYPLTKPEVSTRNDGSKVITYRLAIITDLDQMSKVEGAEFTWRSFMRKGRLQVDNRSGTYSVTWDADLTHISSTLSQGGRSMELSDLKVFDGRLLTIDDRTGVVYKIIGKKAVAWVLLNDGDGSEIKGFKGEWLAVKDQVLHVGGLGKEWTTTLGEFVNYNPMFVKTVTPAGQVRHHNWTEHYIDIRAAAGIKYPGYMIHESAQWSPTHRKWFFLPRRASHSMYTEKTDEKCATNILVIADENFTKFETKLIGTLSETRGFSAFQFVPQTGDRIILALKSEEDSGTIASYYTIFDWTDGRIIMPETKLEGAYKFEGIEFI